MTKLVDILNELTTREANEITFNDYSTSYFYRCQDAKRLFEKLQDVEDQQCIILITNTIKKSDKFFKMEETMMSSGQITAAKFKSFLDQAFNIKFELGKIEEKVGRSLGIQINFVDNHLESMVELYSKIKYAAGGFSWAL